MAKPTEFDGTRSKCRSFLTQCQFYFYGVKDATDQDKVILALSYMKGGNAGKWAEQKALEWAQLEALPSWNQFSQIVEDRFGDPDPATTARMELQRPRQGSMSAEEYCTAFQVYQNESGYNNVALVEKFEQGLKQSLRDQIYQLPSMPSDVRGWMDWAMHFDKQDRKKKAMELLFQSSQKPTSSQSAQKPKPSPNNPFRQYATPATAAATPASASNSNSIFKQIPNYYYFWVRLLQEGYVYYRIFCQAHWEESHIYLNTLLSTLSNNHPSHRSGDDGGMKKKKTCRYGASERQTGGS